MLNGRRIRALRSSTSGHGSFRTRLLQRSSIVPPEAHYKAHGPRVSHTGSLFLNKIRRPPVRLGRNHVERRTRKTAVCGQRTETPPKKRQFKLDRTYRLVAPSPSLKFSGPGEGQSARPPAKARERVVRPFHRLQRAKPCASFV